MAGFRDIPERHEGERIPHEDWNALVQLASRSVSPENFYEDKDGIIIVGSQGVSASIRRHFEMKEAMSPGDGGVAHLRTWDGSAWETSIAEEGEFDVTDPLEIYRGRGKDDFSSPHDEGSLGVAEFNSASGEWEIVQLQPPALMIRGLATALGTGTSTLGIDGVGVLQPVGGIIADQDPADDIEVNNSLADRRWGNNAKVEAEWSEDDEQWEATYIQPLASHLRGTASGAVLASTASFTLSSPAVIQPDDGTVPAGTITVYNDFGWKIDSGGLVIAIWDTANNRYVGLQAECPA